MSLASPKSGSSTPTVFSNAKACLWNGADGRRILTDNSGAQLYVSRVSRAPHWTIADVLDFEWLLARDRAAGEEELQNRDHAIYEKTVAQSPELARARRPLFPAWVEAGVNAATSSFPGACFLSGWQTLVTAAALIGLGLGGSVT